MRNALSVIAPFLSINPAAFLLSVLLPLLRRDQNVKKAMDMFTLVSQLMQLKKDAKDVLDEENCEVLQAHMTFMEDLLADMIPVSQIQGEEVFKIWLQLLHNCLTDAKSILHRYSPSKRQRCVEFLICKPGKLFKEIKEWKQLFDYLLQGLQRDLAVVPSVREAVIAPLIATVISLMKDVIEEEENRQILHSELRPVYNLLLDVSAVFQDQHKAAPEALKNWLQVLQNSLTEANSILHCSNDPNEGRHYEQVQEWKVIFNYLFGGLQRQFSLFVTADLIVNRDPIPAVTTEELEKPLSKDEAWELFRGIAFKDNPVPTDIEEYARNIADECKGFHLAITLVAAAMSGKGTVHDWETSLSSIKTCAGSSPGPESLHPELYGLLKWSYDALPISDIKNCFLYCAMYPRDKEIKVQELMQMWVAEGLVRSKQKNHLMDMAIGQSYVNVLVDRCFFQNTARDRDHVGYRPVWAYPEKQCIRLQHAVREMAVYIGEEEDNCLFKADQALQNFPTIFHNEDCKRISAFRNDIKSLPAEFTCPKLVSLMLSLDYSIEEVPPGFLFSLTSLKVLHLQWSRISSIPSSVGQLKHLEFLSLRRLFEIRDLPEEIGNLSSLQFLDLESCSSLQSLPAKIGELKNLKHLSLKGCWQLKVIPHEISQLTSLTTLDASWVVKLSVEAELEASIWRLKGLSNLAMLRIEVGSSGIEEGIMGTWLDMRHLHLVSPYLPQDMKKMSKLQLFAMKRYRGSSLPDYICKFQHLQAIQLEFCSQLRDLSPLERVPNLKALRLDCCSDLKELGIGNSGGFLMLEKLVLDILLNLESIGGASNNGVWNESTLPRLRMLGIRFCPKLKRFPRGMDKLPNLTTIYADEYWWDQIIWEDGDTKIRLQKLYKKW